MKIDLFKIFSNGNPDKRKDFQASMLEFLKKFMEEPYLTQEQRGRLAKLRAFVDINFKDF